MARANEDPSMSAWKRTCRTLVVHLGTFKSQLVATIVLYIYIYWSFSIIILYFLYCCMFKGFNSHWITLLIHFQSSVCMCVCVYIFIYRGIERERGRERARERETALVRPIHPVKFLFLVCQNAASLCGLLVPVRWFLCWTVQQRSFHWHSQHTFDVFCGTAQQRLQSSQPWEL